MCEDYSGVFFKVPETVTQKKITNLMRGRDITLRVGESVFRKKVLIFAGPVLKRNIPELPQTRGLIKPVKSDKMFFTHYDNFCERTKK